MTRFSKNENQPNLKIKNEDNFRNIANMSCKKKLLSTVFKIKDVYRTLDEFDDESEVNRKHFEVKKRKEKFTKNKSNDRNFS